MSIRTDLALERHAILKERAGGHVRVRKRQRGAAQVTEITVCGTEGARELGKPAGRYITLEVPEFSHDSELLDGRLRAMTEELRALLPKTGGVLVAGLGNEDITPDALGPRTAHGIFATRHIGQALAQKLGFPALREVSAVSFGVLGQTGLESAEALAGLVRTIRPAAVVAVDALASRSLSRLGRTVQLTDTGINPGSGVGNCRARIDRTTLGVPVIAVGVPTVVDASTLIFDLTDGKGPKPDRENEAQAMMVTPREVDTLIQRASRFLSLALNCALQPALDPELLLHIV